MDNIVEVKFRTETLWKTENRGRGAAVYLRSGMRTCWDCSHNEESSICEKCYTTNSFNGPTRWCPVGTFKAWDEKAV